MSSFLRACGIAARFRQLTSSGNNTRHSSPETENALAAGYAVGTLDYAVIDGRGIRIEDLHPGLEGSVLEKWPSAKDKSESYKHVSQFSYLDGVNRIHDGMFLQELQSALYSWEKKHVKSQH